MKREAMIGVGLALTSTLALAAPPPACRVDSVAPVTPATAGFSVSPTDESVALVTRPVGKTLQVFHFDRRSGQASCLSCGDVAGGPRADRHKGAPAFLPDGRHIALQVEMARHPFEGKIGAPGAGWFNDLWLATADGARWWNLTRYPSGAGDRFGVLLPRPSPEGKRIAWAELYADDGEPARRRMRHGQTTDGGAPWGRWRIQVAELVFDGAGEPRLGHRRTLTVPGATWYETQGWSRDGRFLMFASDAGLATPQAMDLWVYNLASGQGANLTRAPQSWEEFGDIAPGGGLIAFMSSACCGFRPTDDKSRLRAELYLTTPDRAWTERLTFFNEPGHAHAKDGLGGSTVTSLQWSRDGRRIWFERPFFAANGRALGSYLMELAFAGACGATPAAGTPRPGR